MLRPGNNRHRRESGRAACLLALALSCCPGTGSATGDTSPAPAANAPTDTTLSDTIASASIHGTVRITRKLISQRMRFRLYPGLKPMAPPESSGTNNELENIVIFLEGVDAGPAAQAPQQNPRIQQEGETFIPHVLPIVKGTTVDFPNLDPIFHNVFSLSGTKSFDLGRYPQGSSRSVTFEQAGIVPVFCHLHSDMSAIVLVLDNPYFAVPDSTGRFRIDNIPPGNYNLVGWHERSDSTEQQVNLQAGESVEVEILIPIEDED